MAAPSDQGPAPAPGGKPRVRVRLAHKITLVSATLLLLIAAGTAWVVRRDMERTLRAEFRSKGTAIAQSLAATGAETILNRDASTIQSMIDDFRKISGVEYVFLVDDTQQQIVTHTFSPAVPPGLLEATRVTDTTAATVRDVTVPGRGRVIDVSVPVVGGAIGFVHVGMSATLLEATVRAVVLRTLAVFALGLLVALVVAGVLARLITRPVASLVETAQAVGRGDLRARPVVTTRDELSVLAHSIGEMTDQLGLMIGRIAGSAEALGEAAVEIRRSLEEVVEGSEGQARLTERTATAMTQVDGAVRAVKASVERLLAAARTSADAVAAMSARTEEVAGSTEQLLKASEETSASATQIAAAIAALDDTASTFTSIVEQTSAAVAAMDRAVAQVAERARETAEAAARSAADAEEGREAVAALARHVEEGREAGRRAAESMTGLQSRMTEISAILQLIDEVADQTNLLALNAAIIAAQAGEQGRGFAVVADEIKALAERTGASVKQIAEVIGTVQREAAATVEMVVASSKRAEAGVEAAARARAALDQIRASSTASGAKTLAIVEAAEGHAQSRETIRASMDRLAAVASGIGKATAEQRAGGVRLREVAEQLQSIAVTVRQATRDQAEQARELTVTMRSVAEMVQEIDSATAEEERQVREVVQAVSEIDAIARKNRASVGRLETVVTRLRERAEGLEAEVGRFQR
ncbi:MAG TPA: methyl-accepting chemotaxis protein [Thermodesulfobacteriota bacterium]|nr:methyl-accepting chemotaxis protein [Thermodesulfobacteriota bacterium]